MKNKTDIILGGKKKMEKGGGDEFNMICQTVKIWLGLWSLKPEEFIGVLDVGEGQMKKKA